MLGSALLASQAIGLEVLTRTTRWADFVSSWPPDLQTSYATSWPEALDPVRIGTDFGWTSSWAAFLALGGLVLAWRSYTSRGEWERWASGGIVLLAVLGTAATLPITVSIAVLLAVVFAIVGTLVATAS